MGYWIGTQRIPQKRGKFSKYKIEKLNDINFIWDSNEYEWNKNYEALIKFLDENNGAYPSRHSKNINEQKLAGWIGSQRMVQKREKLSKDRIEKLNSIGFRW